MITFSNGLSISSVVISTAFGHSGRGFLPFFLFPNYWRLVSIIKREKISVVTKSSTRFSHTGNFVMKDPRTWKYVRKLSDMGMLNAYGLTNDGVEEYAKQIAVFRRKGFNVIPNFYPEFNKGVGVAIKETLEAMKLFCFYFKTARWILELNLSCLNSEEKIAKNIYMAPRCVARIKNLYPNIMVIAKTSIVHPYKFYTMLEKAGTDCIHAINTIPYKMIFDSVSPLEHVGGGAVSGGPAFPKAYPYIKKIPKHTSLPLILGCGIVNQRNMDMYFELGKKFSRQVSVSICTLPARDPKEARKLIYRSLGVNH